MKSNQRKLNPDIKYGDYTVQRLIQYVLKNGNKTTAEKIVYDAIDMVKDDDSVAKGMLVVDIIKKIITNTRPAFEVVSRRVRGATYPVPCEVKARRGEMLALRWILQGAHKRSGNMSNALAQELKDAFNGVGSAVKQRENTHSMAKGSRAFAHLGGMR